MKHKADQAYFFANDPTAQAAPLFCLALWRAKRQISKR